MIRLASINIQGDTNRERIVSFLGEYKPDVVCFQELMGTSVTFFEKTLQMKGHFLPMAKSHVIPQDTGSPIAAFGVGIFSSLPISKVRSDYYYGGVGNLPTIRFKKGSPDDTTLWRGLLSATVTKGPESYTVATTHFTRTKDSRVSDKQRKDLKSLLAITKKSPELILCGDFNAPKGREIFGMLAEKYKDNIPPKYLSSLDPKLHQLRNSKLLLVDGLFTTPQYKVTEVKLSEGVSDHMAVTALISKV